MLTKSERKWLEQRGNPKLYCNWCTGGNDDVWCDYAIATDICPLYEDKASLREAAEFEAKVAVKLSILLEDVHPCPYGASNRCSYDDCGNPHLGCRRSILKYARLQVEEEMDVDS